MNRLYPLRFAAPIALAASLLPVLAQAPADKAGGEWKLVFSDEFDGAEIDKKKWDLDLGNGFFNYESNTWVSGWGNDELQYYTREPDNAFVKDGMLHLKAIKESYQRCGYTSAKIKTRKRDGSALFAQKYGKFEFRAKLPTGKGIWPAIWMLPQDEKYGGWAASGEIDILEAKGHEPNKVLGTLHFGSGWPGNASAGKTLTLPDKETIAEFHVYALEWEPGRMRWAVDGKVYQEQSFWWSSSKRDKGKSARPASERDLNAWPAPFDQPFYIIMNLAVGSRFPGNPDKSTAFPAEMLVDYVRVYDKPGGYGDIPPRGEGKLPYEQAKSKK